jgi:hypothetical protein
MTQPRAHAFIPELACGSRDKATGIQKRVNISIFLKDVKTNTNHYPRLTSGELLALITRAKCPSTKRVSKSFWQVWDKSCGCLPSAKLAEFIPEFEKTCAGYRSAV